MASSDFRVNLQSLPQVISVAWGQAISCVLVSTQGVNSVTWSVIGKSRSTLSTPTLTPAGSPFGSSMSFTFPSAGAYGEYGGSLLIQCVVSYTVAGKARTHTTRAVIGVAMPLTGVVPGALGETTERGSYGWLEILNALRAWTGFQVTTTSADVAVTGGGGATTIYDYDLSAVVDDAGAAIVDGQSLLIDVRVEAWRTADPTVAGYCDFTAHITYGDGTPSASDLINDPDVEQTTSSTWEAGLSVTAAIVSDTTLRISATSTTTNVRCNVLISHRQPLTRSTS